jgi:uncharacterized membrane protein HdeD (DUF308 family)
MMTMPNSSGGGLPPTRPLDPAYQRVRPDPPFGRSDQWGGSGDRRSGDPAMSALLAQNWWAVALRGVFAILFGLAAIVLPGVTLGSLVLLFAVYMVADGIFAILAGVRAARHRERWGLLIVEGIADLIAGAIAFLFPLATVLAFVILMAAWAIITGGLLLAAAFRLHYAHGRWLMGFGGLASLIWGVLLLVWPLTGALVLTWWMGAYALFFGGALIALAVRLHRQHHEPGVATGWRS